MQNGTHYRTCHLCEAMCGVAVEMKDGKIVSIYGDNKDPLSRGHICPKAVALQDLHEDPERLRKPVRRTPMGWQEIRYVVSHTSLQLRPKQRYTPAWAPA